MKNKVPNLIVLNPYSQGFLVFAKLTEGNLERMAATNYAREIFHSASSQGRVSQSI